MELNIEEAKEKTLEYLNRKSYSLVRPDFSKYDQMYLFSTENLSYLEKIDVNKKDALTVTGSFDQALNLIHEGANSICNFDKNVNTVFLAYLKIAAMKAFSYEEYLQFFLGENRFDYQMYLRLTPFLGTNIKEYWNYIYGLFSYDNKALLSSRLFDMPSSVKKTVLSNPYLKTEEDYNYTKARLDEVSITFEEKNLLEIGEEEKQYDVMLFSNIEFYLVEDGYATMSENEYMDFIQNKASKQLKDGGVIQVAYQYCYKRRINVTGNFLKKLFKTKYEFQKIDYMEGKFKTVTFMGAPLWKSVEMSNDIKDCVYLYENVKGKRM